jgi:pilus assembly protein Flp/PilA
MLKISRRSIEILRIYNVLALKIVYKAKGVKAMLFEPKEKGWVLSNALILVLVAIVVIVILVILGPAISNVLAHRANL